jgi:hypothetical protein
LPKKVIVTHIFPDLDAIAAAWLLIRFHPDFSETDIKFVPAGGTYQNLAVDSDPTVIHVDTGLGQFDHHQLKTKTAAAELVFNHLKEEKLIAEKHLAGLERLIKLVVAFDNFDDFFWPEPNHDRYDLELPELINNLKISGKLNDKELVYQGMLLLDAALTGLTIKSKSEQEIKTGRQFKTKWGKGIAVMSQNSSLSKLAQKLGFSVIVVKDPKTGFASVKSQPKPEIDLEPVYLKLKAADPQASWFFHQSRHIISNGSRHNQAVKATSLDLEEIIKIVTSV